jgi:hypothetical protein
MRPPPPRQSIPKTFPSDQCLDPNLVALRCLGVERAMGIEPKRVRLCLPNRSDAYDVAELLRVTSV